MKENYNWNRKDDKIIKCAFKIDKWQCNFWTHFGETYEELIPELHEHFDKEGHWPEEKRND